MQAEAAASNARLDWRAFTAVFLHHRRATEDALTGHSQFPALRAVQQDVDTRSRELVRGELHKISIEVIVQAAKENDSLAIRVLDEAMSHIGVALADVVNLLIQEWWSSVVRCFEQLRIFWML